MVITCPVNDSVGLCATMDSVGAGLGVFLQYLGQALPTLLIILAVIGFIGLIVFAVAKAIGNSIQHVKMR